MELNEKIKMLRKSQGITLRDIADIVGVSEPTVQRWETGNIKNMRRDKIGKLAKALHTSPAYLMGWTDDPTPPEPSVQAITLTNRTDVEAFGLFTQLDDIDKGKTIANMEHLLEAEKYH